MINLIILIKVFLTCFFISCTINVIFQVILKGVRNFYDKLSLVVLKLVLNNNKNDDKIPFLVRYCYYILLKFEYFIEFIYHKKAYKVSGNCKLLFYTWIFYKVLLEYNKEIFNILKYIFLSKIYLVIIFIITIIILKGSYKRRLRKNLKEDIYKEVIKEYLSIKDYIWRNIIDEYENSFIFWRRIRRLEYSNKIFDEENNFIEEHLREKLNDLGSLQYFGTKEEINEIYMFLYKNLPVIKELKHSNELILEKIMEFLDKYDKGSKHQVIDSIDPKLGMYMLELKSMYTISGFYLGKKRYIGFFNEKEVGNFKEEVKKSMINNLSMFIRVAFILDKIEHRIKLDKKEDSVSEYIINKFKK
ncbi:hypothetical protein LI058_13625 [Clostridium perfringens]|uniref:hypothetical protein n=1 Tax=Clostridium perfringens TaxID=1502 RepID=UPI002245D180|nr:hypothetical protein [Clostridium perfringens]MCX0374505.1 hypothetical protein [Clostridium perfringens]